MRHYGRRRVPRGARLLAPVVALLVLVASDGAALRRVAGNGAAAAAPVALSAVETSAGPAAGLLADPEAFPLAVWLQSPANARAYQDIGINLYVGLWQGPTEAQLDALAEANMPVLAAQNAVGLARGADPLLRGWTQQDEPDNAQPDGEGGYGPCVPPETIQARYAAMKAADPDRPVFLNLGQGVAWDRERPFVGRGSACADRWDHYPAYARGADILSFDIYPVTSPYEHIRGDLSRVALGVERLRAWAGPEQAVWNVIETTHIHADTMPTPAQVRAEAWMSIVHGSRGLIYFAHEWVPQFREAGLLHYPEMREGVAALNAEIQALAPALRAPPDPDAVTVEAGAVPVAVLATHAGAHSYLFAVSLGEQPTTARFRLRGAGAASLPVEVLGEDRGLRAQDGAFEDAFTGYAVHLYRLPRLDRGGLALPWLGRGAAGLR